MEISTHPSCGKFTKSYRAEFFLGRKTERERETRVLNFRFSQDFPRNFFLFFSGPQVPPKFAFFLTINELIVLRSIGS